MWYQQCNSTLFLDNQDGKSHSKLNRIWLIFIFLPGGCIALAYILHSKCLLINLEYICFYRFQLVKITQTNSNSPVHVISGYANKNINDDKNNNKLMLFDRTVLLSVLVTKKIVCELEVLAKIGSKFMKLLVIYIIVRWRCGSRRSFPTFGKFSVSIRDS